MHTAVLTKRVNVNTILVLKRIIISVEAEVQNNGSFPSIKWKRSRESYSKHGACDHILGVSEYL